MSTIVTAQQARSAGSRALVTKKILAISTGEPEPFDFDDLTAKYLSPMHLCKQLPTRTDYTV